MYNELIKALRETDFSDGCPCGAEPMCKDKDCVILQAADAIEDLSAAVEGYESSTNMAFVEKDGETVIEFQPKWIPVTERLPEGEKDVLVWVSIDQHPIYPLTIIQDRYNGIYSGGKFTAWNLYPNELPDEVFSDDVTCGCFWADQEITVGRGNTPDEALAMLAVSLEREKRFWEKNEE